MRLSGTKLLSLAVEGGGRASRKSTAPADRSFCGCVASCEEMISHKATKPQSHKDGPAARRPPPAHTRTPAPETIRSPAKAGAQGSTALTHGKASPPLLWPPAFAGEHEG